MDAKKTKTSKIKESKKDAMKKKIKQKQKQKQKQRQETNINIKINSGESKQKSDESASSGGFRQLPPVVYQTLPQLTYYARPDEQGRLAVAPDSRAGPSMIAAPKPATTILEDIGSVGTEGLVEIMDRPTKRETLSELITPITKPKPRSEGIKLDNEFEPKTIIGKRESRGAIAPRQPSILTEPPKLMIIEPEPKPRQPLIVQPEKLPERMVQKPPLTSSLISSQMPQSSISEPSMMSGKTIFNERPEEPPMTGPIISSPSPTQKTEPQMKTKTPSGKVSQPQEMQRDIFSQMSKQETGLFQPPASPATIATYARPPTLEAIMASLPPELDVRAKAGKQGGLFSKKMSKEQKIEAYASFAGIPKSQIIPEQIDQLMQEAKMEYQRTKKRESRQKAAQKLPEKFL